MDVPLAPLLGFLGWTPAMPAGTIRVHRGSPIATGHASAAQRRADEAQEPDGSRRAMRAHPDGIENLPVDGAAVPTTGTRTGRTIVHVAVPPTGRVERVRFSPLAVHLACMTAMGAVVGATLA